MRGRAGRRSERHRAKDRRLIRSRSPSLDEMALHLDRKDDELIRIASFEC
jgi:hypothetical protein